MKLMYIDYGYIGKDGIEYATIDEAIEAEIEEYEEIIASINASEKKEKDEQ